MFLKAAKFLFLQNIAAGCSREAEQNTGPLEKLGLPNLSGLHHQWTCEQTNLLQSPAADGKGLDDGESPFKVSPQNHHLFSYHLFPSQ